MDSSKEMDKERLTAEMAFKDSSSAVIKIRQRLPDFLQSVKLKYVKLGYGYSYNFATILMFLLIVPLFISTAIQLTGLELDRVFEFWTNRPTIWFDLDDLNAATRLIGSALFVILLGLYWARRSRPVYLVDFACYKPDDERKVTREFFFVRGRNIFSIAYAIVEQDLKFC